MDATGENRGSDGGGRERAAERAHYLHETGQHEVVRLPELQQEGSDAVAAVTGPGPEVVQRRFSVTSALATARAAYRSLRDRH